MKFFVCTYTNAVKSYCDARFFERFDMIAKGHAALVVDNTHDNERYASRLMVLTDADVEMTHSEKGPHQFLRNVIASVNLCRERFLASDCEAMLTIESDVIPPVDLVATFERDAALLEPENWGIIGGLYYRGWHDFSLKGLVRAPHVLSGCTIYKRKLVELFEFDGHPVEHLCCFPDAVMSSNSLSAGFTNWNDHAIVCEHLEKSPGDRGHAGLE